jgi:hypothetical protein
MAHRTFAVPEVLEAYSPAMVGRVAASRPPLEDYQAAVAAFNAAPNEVGFAIPDRSAQIGADLDALAEVDRQPALFATALRSADVLRWVGHPLLFSLALLTEVWRWLPSEELGQVLERMVEARLREMAELLQGAGDLTPEQFAEQADDIAAAFAWVAEAGVDNPEILDAVFGDWDAGQMQGLLANLSRYGSEDGLAPGDPEAMERLLDPTSRALGLAVSHGALDPAAVRAMTGGDGCPAFFDGFDDAYHQAQGRQLLLGHADAFPADVAAALAHHAITVEPLMLEAREESGQYVHGVTYTPATLYLDHRYGADLEALTGWDAPFPQDMTTYALLAIDGWTDGPNEAAFEFATGVHPRSAYERLVADDVNTLLTSRIISDGLARYPVHSPDAGDAERAERTLMGFVDGFAAESRGRFSGMPDELRRAIASAIASDPDTLFNIIEEAPGDQQSDVGDLIRELMRDEQATSTLLAGVRNLQVQRLGPVIDAHVGDSDRIDLDALLRIDEHNRVTDVAQVFDALDGLAEEAGRSDELRSALTNDGADLVLGLVPKLPVKEVVGLGGLVVDLTQLESELDALGDDRREGISRNRGTSLVLLAHMAETHPAVMENHLDAGQRDALDAALREDDPQRRAAALDEVWGDLRDNEVRELITHLVRNSTN